MEFQSTLPRGERLSICTLLRFLYYFNPRSHEGSDLFVNPIQSLLHYFNPRSHEGSDDYEAVEIIETYISIHAPTRGAT